MAAITCHKLYLNERRKQQNVLVANMVVEGYNTLKLKSDFE